MLKSWIKVRSFGGADTVTGSCHMVTATIDGYDYNYLVDCGLFQGKIANENYALHFNLRKFANDINAVFVTHAHIDHIGRIPALYRWGYRGPIYATEPAIELSRIMLEDSAKIQLDEYAKRTKKELANRFNGERYNHVELLYEVNDAISVMDQFMPVEREVELEINRYLTVTFYDACHGLGSSSIKLCFNNGYETCKMLFSGDLGNMNNPILKKSEMPYFTDIDAVFVETTYAGRVHGSQEENWKDVRQEIANTILKGGKVILPAFAVGRTQEMLYVLYKDIKTNSDDVAKVLKNTNIYVDSTLAVLATKVFRRFPSEFTLEIQEMIKAGNSPFGFAKLHLVKDKQESFELCTSKEPCIILSASGMCEAGRVIFHLRENLDNPNNTIILTGYQGENMIGRKILEGQKVVNVAGKRCSVLAKVLYIDTLSAHADQLGIMKWLHNIEPGYELFLIHGEAEAQRSFKALIERDRLVSDVVCMETYSELEMNNEAERKTKMHNKFSKAKKQKVLELEEQLEMLEEQSTAIQKAKNKITREINEMMGKKI